MYSTLLNMSLINILLWLAFINIVVAWKLESRIVGGVDASDGDFPFIVSQRITNKHNCGGTILTERHVLTAAHCVHEWVNFTQYLSIQYGTATIGPDKGKIVQVKNVVVHEKWNNSAPGYYNDVAILELEEDIIFDQNASPVELSDPDEKLPDLSTLSLLGWGLLSSNGSRTSQLQYTEILLYDDYYCLMLEDLYDPNTQLCGGLPDGGAGQCSGDSGGPAIIDGKQVGIISWSVKPCASPQNPGFFARVSFYRLWIYQHTGV